MKAEYNFVKYRQLSFQDVNRCLLNIKQEHEL